jgi:excinuclease UvrABC helicase subunit UvrB
MLNFNDLYDDFFNRRRNAINPLHDEIKKIIDSIATFKNIQNEANLEKEIDKELGKPSSIETRIEDGVVYKKLVWNTPFGNFVKIIVSDVDPNNPAEDPNDPSYPFPQKKQKGLEQQLKEAVDSEDYELAIQLRDQIKAEKKPKRKRKEKK